MATRPKDRCDICIQRDGWKGMCIQKCCKCGVCVHEECYGIESTKSKIADWRCWPCEAVETTTTTVRPTECALCSVSDGVHAMHALYQYMGENDRQAFLPAHRTAPERLAWVHTVCARGVSSHVGTRGAVYGCHENGEESLSDLIHHFVMCGLTRRDDEEQWIRVLDEHCRLPCTICEETSETNLRVPLQCCAGDEDEYYEFRQHHEDVVEVCIQAMHVGCAMWRQKGVRRMWFIPRCARDEDDVAEDVVGIFCDLHATQMGASMT
jgi:hypothetical protein